MKVLGFTGNRADYYLQQPLFRLLNESPLFDLQLIVTGSILEESTQKTLGDINADKIPIAECITLEKTSGSSHSLHIAQLLSSLDPVLENLQPDLALVYADRYESFAFALAAFHRNLVVMHLEAGDITEGGTYDDSLRHAITKISHLHATSTLKGLATVSALGEEPWRSIHAGLLSNDSFSCMSLHEAGAVASSLNIDRSKSLIIATMHPIPMDPSLTEKEASEFLLGLSKAAETGFFDIILTAPNRDQGADIISDLIRLNIAKIKHCTYIESLGGYRYQALLSLARFKNVIVCGNSSSVIKEAPFYGAHGVNIGMRQAGREKASTQHDVTANRDAISQLLVKLATIQCEPGFNPYFSTSPSRKVHDFILSTFERHTTSSLLLKRWHSQDE